MVKNRFFHQHLQNQYQNKINELRRIIKKKDEIIRELAKKHPIKSKIYRLFIQTNKPIAKEMEKK